MRIGRLTFALTLMLAAAVSLTAFLAAPARAVDGPAWSWSNVHVGVQARYAWWESTGGVVPTGFGKEWEVATPIVYSLHRTSLFFSPALLTDSRVFRGSVGLNYELPIWGGRREP